MELSFLQTTIVLSSSLTGFCSFVQTDLETKIAETPKLESSVQANVSKVDGTDLLLYYQVSLIEIKKACPIIK